MSKRGETREGRAEPKMVEKDGELRFGIFQVEEGMRTKSLMQ